MNVNKISPLMNVNQKPDFGWEPVNKKLPVKTQSAYQAQNTANKLNVMA